MALFSCISFNFFNADFSILLFLFFTILLLFKSLTINNNFTGFISQNTKIYMGWYTSVKMQGILAQISRPQAVISVFQITDASEFKDPRKAFS